MVLATSSVRNELKKIFYRETIPPGLVYSGHDDLMDNFVVINFNAGRKLKISPRQARICELFRELLELRFEFWPPLMCKLYFILFYTKYL